MIKFSRLDRVQRTDNSLSAAVSIDHRRADVLMPQQVLHRTDVISRRQQIRRKAVPQRVACDRLDNSSRPGSCLNCFADNGFMDVETFDHAQTAALHGLGHQLFRSVHARDETIDLFSGHNRRHPQGLFRSHRVDIVRHLHFQHLVVEK